MTAAAVALIARRSDPVRLTPLPSKRATVPETSPANPAALLTNRPLPFVSDRPWVPTPRVMLTSFRPMMVIALPSVATPRSTARSACNCWPRIVSVRFEASTRTYGPAGRSKTTVPTVRLTAVPVVLSAMWPSTSRARAEIARWALSCPATPLEPSRSDPEMLVTAAAVPKERATFWALTKTSVPTREKPKSPVRLCPPMARVAAVTEKSVTAAASTKTISTGGSVLPGIETDWLIAEPVVLMRTLVVPVIVTPVMPRRLTTPVATRA